MFLLDILMMQRQNNGEQSEWRDHMITVCDPPMMYVHTV